MVKVKNSGEIDLLELFLKGINIIRANFWLIVLFFCLGTALGVGYYYSSKKVYESKMVISSGILTRPYSENLMDRLARHRRELDIEAIINLLGVSDKTARSVGNIDIESISKTDDPKEADKFVITAYVLDQEVLPELQKGLIHYIENNEYVKIRVEQNRNYLKQTLAKIEQEIRDMEEFKQKIVSGAFFQIAKGNVMFDPTTVNSKILDLTKEKINLQNSLALSNSVQVIEGFSKFQRPVSPKLSISMIAGSFVGLFFVGVLITFKSIRRLVRMADSAKQKA